MRFNGELIIGELKVSSLVCLLRYLTGLGWACAGCFVIVGSVQSSQDLRPDFQAIVIPQDFSLFSEMSSRSADSSDLAASFEKNSVRRGSIGQGTGQLRQSEGTNFPLADAGQRKTRFNGYLKHQDFIELWIGSQIISTGVVQLNDLGRRNIDFDGVYLLIQQADGRTVQYEIGDFLE